MQTQMWMLTKHWWIFFLVLLSPGIIMLAIGILNPGARTDDGHSLLMVGAVFTSIMVIIEAGVFVYLGRQKKRVAYFAQNGVQGSATILKAETTGIELNGMPQIELLLEITLPGQAPYTISNKSYWNLLSLSSLKRGARLTVRVDPKNRKRIMFVDEDAGPV